MKSFRPPRPLVGIIDDMIGEPDMPTITLNEEVEQGRHQVPF